MESENEDVEEEIVERLNRIAMRIYGKHYFELGEFRRRATTNLYDSGDF